MRVTLRERRFGELLQQCFALTAAHFVPLVVIAAVFNLPQLAGQVLLHGSPSLGTGQPSADDLAAGAGVVGLSIVGWLLWPIAQGAAIFLVSGSFTGRSVSLGEAFKNGVRRWPSLLAFGIAYGILTFLGFFAVIVGAIIVAIMFFVGPPAIVVEGVGWTDGFGRSRQLTRGHRWTIFFLALVVGLIVGFAPYAAIGVLAVATGGVDAATGALSLGFVLAAWAVGAVGYAVMTVLPVVIYFNLRVAKEAFDTDQIASMVDQIGERHATGPA